VVSSPAWLPPPTARSSICSVCVVLGGQFGLHVGVFVCGVRWWWWAGVGSQWWLWWHGGESQ
jgi:hypothetical protein